jgi:hypothetical protein
MHHVWKISVFLQAALFQKHHHTMKQTLTFLFVILLFLFPRLYAQDFWETLPFPDTAHVYCMAVNNQGHIFVGAGSNNTIGGVYRSMDGGVNWEFMLDMGDFGVLSLEINNQGAIYAGTNHGFHPLYASYDNGATWVELLYPTELNVIKIKSRGADTLYVSLWVGNGPLVLKSEDGGFNWDTIFYDQPPTSTVQYVKDIAITASGIIYLGLSGYFPDSGGVYKSEDDGATWELSGLFNHMVSSLAINSENDLFAGVRGWVPDITYPGLFVLRDGDEEWTELMANPLVSDVVINCNNHIYFSSQWPNGVLRSLDNGQSFELINSGLPSGPKGAMIIDNAGFLYLTSETLTSSLYKSSASTITSVPEYKANNKTPELLVFPNPASGGVFIQLIPGVQYSGSGTLFICDVSGRVVMQKNNFQLMTPHQLYIDDLVPGFYFVTLVSDEKNITKKLIIQ